MYSLEQTALFSLLQNSVNKKIEQGYDIYLEPDASKRFFSNYVDHLMCIIRDACVLDHGRRDTNDLPMASFDYALLLTLITALLSWHSTDCYGAMDSLLGLLFTPVIAAAGLASLALFFSLALFGDAVLLSTIAAMFLIYILPITPFFVVFWMMGFPEMGDCLLCLCREIGLLDMGDALLLGLQYAIISGYLFLSFVQIGLFVSIGSTVKNVVNLIAMMVDMVTKPAMVGASSSRFFYQKDLTMVDCHDDQVSRTQQPFEIETSANQM